MNLQTFVWYAPLLGRHVGHTNMFLNGKEYTLNFARHSDIFPELTQGLTIRVEITEGYRDTAVEGVFEGQILAIDERGSQEENCQRVLIRGTVSGVEPEGVNQGYDFYPAGILVPCLHPGM